MWGVGSNKQNKQKQTTNLRLSLPQLWIKLKTSKMTKEGPTCLLGSHVGGLRTSQDLFWAFSL
jgi:hypothetical protein